MEEDKMTKDLGALVTDSDSDDSNGATGGHNFLALKPTTGGHGGALPTFGQYAGNSYRGAGRGQKHFDFGEEDDAPQFGKEKYYPDDSVLDAQMFDDNP